MTSEVQAHRLGLVKSQPDLTLAELRQRVLAEKGVSMTVATATDTDIFLDYLNHFLCPALTPEQVVVRDNLSLHKADGVRKWIEAVGAELLSLPPCSLDLNFIEKAGAKRRDRQGVVQAYPYRVQLG